MPQVISSIPETRDQVSDHTRESGRSSPPEPIRWTCRQFHEILEQGILVGRYELIDGEILSKIGQKRPHALTIMLLMKALIALFGVDYVQCQLPMPVRGRDGERNEPEPDAVVLSRPALEFREENPSAEDALLVVEVADSSISFDRNRKAALYARAGVGDYWIIDLNDRQILVHRQPSSEGYGEVTAFRSDELLTALARPDAPVRVADLLPPDEQSRIRVALSQSRRDAKRRGSWTRPR